MNLKFLKTLIIPKVVKDLKNPKELKEEKKGMSYEL